MTQKILGVVMDPIDSIKPYKDTSLALLLAAQRRGWTLQYLEQTDLFIRDGQACGRMRPLEVSDDLKQWHRFRGEADARPLAELDCLLMRKDPPFDMNYITSTYVLELAQRQGVLVVNDPRSLRDCNEKLFTAWFPELCPPTLFSANESTLKAFHAEHGDVIFKPVDGMGGSGVFRVSADGQNLGAVIEQLSAGGERMIVAQRFLPGISDGDKRVLMVDGEAVPYCLARIPAKGETRGNLAAGGRGEARPLGEAEKRIAERVGPELRRRGLLFVGLDVIGEQLTEINVTSPTCAREIDAAFNTDIGALLMEAIERRLH